MHHLNDLQLHIAPVTHPTHTAGVGRCYGGQLPD